MSTLDYKEAAVSDIAAAMGNIQLSDKGILELKIKNTGESAKNSTIRLIVPKELTVDKDKLSVKLPAKSEASAKFKIEKFSALPGSSYAVFAVIEYDDGKHFTSTANAIINVVKEKKLFFMPYWTVIAIIAVLSIAFVRLQFVKVKKND